MTAEALGALCAALLTIVVLGGIFVACIYFTKDEPAVPPQKSRRQLRKERRARGDYDPTLDNILMDLDYLAYEEWHRNRR